jgi:hypothetical protein
MGWTDFFIGAIVGGVAIGILTTETGKSITRTTGKAISEKYANLLS